MKILGINISHDQSSCLIDDGEVIYFAEDEKLIGVKHFFYSNHDLDNFRNGTSKVAFINKLKSYTNYVDYIIFTSFDREVGQPFSDQYHIDFFLKNLKDNGVDYGEYIFERDNHHIYHAANGFYSSGFDDAVCLILDGGGSLYKKPEVISKLLGKEYANTNFREVESFYEFSYGSLPKKLKQVWAENEGDGETYVPKINDDDELVYVEGDDVLTSTWSNGMMFNLLCSIVGFDNGHDAGKMMGLASYAKEYHEEDAYDFEKVNWFTSIDGYEITSSDIKKIINSEEFVLNLFDRDNFEKDLQVKARIAKKLQDETLKHTNNLISKALEMSSSRNIVLSGGYALNCLNNYKYLNNLPEDVKIFVDPISSDAGTSLGAAKYLWYKLTNSKEKKPLTSLYMG